MAIACSLMEGNPALPPPLQALPSPQAPPLEALRKRMDSLQAAAVVEEVAEAEVEAKSASFRPPLAERAVLAAAEALLVGCHSIESSPSTTTKDARL